ncbi:MAG: helix-turn-helix transcriptional regulator [Coriobacteriales bacterium]|nr:helix-turn-helix transcriptional regulator [Coriobacteriales bacterium]
METVEFTSHRIELGQRIAGLRNNQRLSGRKFALMIGISRTYLRKIESAEASPTFDMLERIAAGLGVPVAELVSFNDTKDESLSLEYYDFTR